MRKSASVILLLILLFNMVGYRAWFYYAERQSDARMEARLDNAQYNENELISLSIPLNNPYQLEQRSFVRVNGEINLQGKTFKYVKRKVTDGNLVLLCIPDAHKTDLKKAKSDFSNSVNDLTGTSKNQSKTGLQKNFNSYDYINDCSHHLLQQPADLFLSQYFSGSNDLTDVYIASPGKPPQYLA